MDEFTAAWKGDKPKAAPNGANLVLAMFSARTAAHVMHLTTRSYAAHVALDEFYTGIVDVADRFAEAYQGAHGPLKFPDAALASFVGEPVAMLKQLRNTLSAGRAAFEPHMQQILDDGIELIDSTTYKLTLLK